MKILGIDVGSTTVKGVLVEDDRTLWQAYRRHHTKQAETVREFLAQLETEYALEPGRDIILFTGSGSGFIAPLVGGRVIQEVVAVAAAVERFHPQVSFVSEIGGEDMKSIFFTGSANGKSKQVYMQSACSGGTGTFIEKTARKLNVTPENLAQMDTDGLPLHKISSKCGIFAETDANTLIKGGVPVEEIMASLFEAVVYQNLATLTKGNTPAPEVLLLGGPNLFFKGLQQARRRNLAALWAERRIACDQDTDALIHVPTEALYYASLGCIEIARHDGGSPTYYSGRSELQRWIEHGQHEEKAKQGAKGLVSDDAERESFLRKYVVKRPAPDPPAEPSAHASERAATPVMVGCDFGSTTAKAVVLAADQTLLFSCYALSHGNPIEDAKDLMRQIQQAGFETIGGLALTGYGKDLLNDILGADVSVVETVAHARAALHFFPDADVICDVGGCDVKVMILRNGTVADFRLNSQCSSGNGAFLQGVADRYGVPLEDYADHAFRAKSLPQLAMGCGVFLQSDIVNQQRKGWSADEIMASLAAVLPLNVWVYACQLQNLRAVGRKFVLQGGTHRNAAVVKAQVDFITGKVPDAEIVIHPYSGEAGAIGAALCAADAVAGGGRSRFRGFAAVEALTYRSTTSDQTVCHWCSCNCKRTFIDVQLPGAAGRPWSKIPVPEGWQRVISGNSCPKGLMEDVDEMRTVKARIDEAKRAYPNVAEMVRATAFHRG